MKIRGSPQVQLRVRPSQKRGMLVAYLYDVDQLGWGTVITHRARRALGHAGPEHRLQL